MQDLDIDNADMAVTYAGTPAGSPLAQPFIQTKTGSADGESVRTSFIAYDSLGTAATVDLTFVLQSTTPSAGSTWEFVAESSDNDTLDRVVGLGVVEFDANGRFVSATNQSFSLVRTNGAVSPLTVSMGFDDGTRRSRPCVYRFSAHPPGRRIRIGFEVVRARFQFRAGRLSFAGSNLREEARKGASLLCRLRTHDHLREDRDGDLPPEFNLFDARLLSRRLWASRPK